MTPLTIYAGLAADRNARGMRGARILGEALSAIVGKTARVVGAAAAPVPGGWAEQLATARADLGLLKQAIGEVLDAGLRPLSVMGRCAASVATLPAVARRHPEAVVVWFDAHGDCNVPRGADSYLGGMVLTGAAGLWDTGLGADLALAQVILVGSRDLDPPEMDRIARGELGHVRAGAGLAARLAAAVHGRPVYVHIDCDVLDAGLLATEYQVPDGLSFAQLREACAVLAACPLIGLEITEYEGAWPDGQPSGADGLLEAIAPLLAALA